VHPNAEQIVGAAEGLGLSVEVRTFPDGTRTAADAADAVGTDIDTIVKSLVFVMAERDAPVLALVSGGNRLDEQKLAAAAGVGAVTRADADAVRRATGFPIGGVPPFGHPLPLPTYVDQDLLGHAVVWAAAGTPRDVFAVDPAELVTAIGAVVVELAVTTRPVGGPS
jgi:prolyl-tRNA editing enzyme YbaK/EbsC (Cys-tRNA(Pro) deacylase)